MLQDAPPVTTQERTPRGGRGAFWELVRSALSIAITVAVLRIFLFQPFMVQGQSMEPTLSQQDYLIVDKLSYRLREPH